MKTSLSIVRTAIARAPQMEPPSLILTEQTWKDILKSSGIRFVSVCVSPSLQYVTCVCKTLAGTKFEATAQVVVGTNRSYYDSMNNPGSIEIKHDTVVHVYDYNGDDYQNVEGPAAMKEAFIAAMKKSYDRSYKRAVAYEKNKDITRQTVESLKANKFEMNGIAFKLVALRGTTNMRLNPTVKADDGSFVCVRIECMYTRTAGGDGTADTYNFKVARYRPNWTIINIGDDTHHINAPTLVKDAGDPLTPEDFTRALNLLNKAYVLRLMKKYNMPCSETPSVKVS